MQDRTVLRDLLDLLDQVGPQVVADRLARQANGAQLARLVKLGSLVHLAVLARSDPQAHRARPVHRVIPADPELLGRPGRADRPDPPAPTATPSQP
jgi:hypothetical protein